MVDLKGTIARLLEQPQWAHMRKKPRPPKTENQRKTINARLRFTILAKAGFRCTYCGNKPRDTELHVDHVLPVSRGGLNTEANLVAACRTCNIGKSNFTIEELARGR